MIALVLTLTGLALPFATGGLLLTRGLRSGDRPGDAAVTAAAGTAAQPDGCWPVVVVAVRNPGPAPVLVGLSARPWGVPAWLDGGRSVFSPARTARRRFRAGRHDLVGVVGPGEVGRWQVPAPGGRRCRLVAVVGQSDGRLRVTGIALGRMPRPEPAACEAPALTDQDR